MASDLKDSLASLKIERDLPAKRSWRWPVLLLVPAILVLGVFYGLRVRQVDLWLHIIAELAPTNVVHHADHSVRSLRLFRLHDLLSNRILARPEAVGQRTVHDDDGRRVRAITFREHPPAQQSHAEGSEVVAAHGQCRD